MAAAPLDPSHVEILGSQRPPRKLAIYSASAGFDLVEELDHLAQPVGRAQHLLQPALPRSGHAQARGPRGAPGGDPRRRRIPQPPAPAGTLLGRAPVDPARRLGAAHLVQPLRPARHAAARPRRPGRRHRGLLRDDGPPASQVPESVRLPRDAARRSRRKPAEGGGRSQRAAARHHQRGRAPIPRQRSGRRRLSPAVAAEPTISANSAG